MMNEDVPIIAQEVNESFNVTFLSEIHEILSKLEVGQDIDSLTNKVKELIGKFDQAKQEIAATGGIDSTKERQETVLKSLQQQLQIKRQVIEKYQNLTLSRNQPPTL
ncbi:uncharacterized protein LOC144425173 [Styela clava]